MELTDRPQTSDGWTKVDRVREPLWISDRMGLTVSVRLRW